MANFPVGNTLDTPIVFPYSAIDLTSAIDVIPNQWGLLDEMGMFEEDGVDTTIIEINYRDGFINLLANAERGTIPQAVVADDEGAIFLKVPHFPDTDLITPKDLENRWAFVRGDNVPRRRRTLEESRKKGQRRLRRRRHGDGLMDSRIGLEHFAGGAEAQA